MDFIAIDFETAYTANNSACSLGLAFVDNLEIVNTEYYLIQPPTLVFNKINIGIHGIKPSDVKDSPKFPEIWEKIKCHFTQDHLIIAHNARFDMSVLKCCLEYYDIEFPDFNYACSIPISTKVCSGEIGRSLSARANFFSIEMAAHHNALSDTITCAKIVIETVNRSKQKTFQSFVNVRAIEGKSFLELNPARNLGKALFADIAYDELLVSESDSNNAHIFSGKSIVLTGELSSMARSEAIQKLVNLGAVIQRGVTKKTDFLIVGTQDNSVVGEDGLSGKEEKAYQLIAQGQDIKIIKEDDFLKLL